MKIWLLLPILIIALTISSCSSNLFQNQTSISKAQYGSAWAFKVDEGLLECKGENSIGEVVFISGKTYALNGVAKQANKYALIDEILLDEYKTSNNQPDLTVFINEGLKLCRK